MIDIEDPKFPDNSRVIFVDRPRDTNLVLNGRIGTIMSSYDEIVPKDGDTPITRYVVKWDDKNWWSGEDVSIISQEVLRIADLDVPELYALHIMYHCYTPYEKSGFCSVELEELAKARENGLLKDILKHGGI